MENEMDTQSLNEGTVDVTVESQGTETSSDDVVDTEELAKARELANNYKIRAEKAEARLKGKASDVETKTPKNEVRNDAQGSLTKDEGKLYSRVYSSDLPDELADSAVERVKKIAQLEGISLDEAYRSDDYKFWQERKSKEFKQEQSQLRATRGGRPQVRKSLDTSGLSEAEHKALWRERVS